MANVKVPALLHKMSVASQKAWYKKNNMELPGHLTGKEGKSAAQAKKDVGEINKQKAKEKTSLQKALETSPKQKELKKSSERVRQMASNALAFGGQRPGGDLTTARGIVSYIRGGGYLKAGRLGEAAKPDASMAMTDQLKKKMITDKDKQTLGKVAALMSSAKNKDKKNEYVRQLGLKAMRAGKVDPARGHIPTRAGREELKKEGFDPEPADIAAHLVKKHGKGKVTSKHLDAYEGDRDTRRGLDREEIMKHVKKLSEETVNEVSKAEAEKVLGGAVKEKPKMPPGKQPAGYRYVRGLARKAMKAGLKKEEVEVIETPEVVVEQDDSMEKKEMAQTQLHFMAYAAKEILEFIDMGGEIEEWYQNKLSKVQSEVESLHSYIEGEKRRTGMVKEEEQIDEKAPPGAKYERMVKHIKSQYAKDGLTGKEKAIAYATAWKAYGKKEEVETVEEQEVMKHGTKGGSTPEQKAKDYDEKWDRYKNAKKPANEEVEQVEERYVGFKKLKASIAAKGGARDPGAVAAAIGRKKYGKEKFQAAAAAGKKLAKEEVVVEAEGAEPTTPREKTLAAKHGDPKKITYGDVIKARIQSAKNKALKGKE